MEQKDKQKRMEDFKKYLEKLETDGKDKDMDLTFYSFKKKQELNLKKQRNKK